jgi:GDP-D-mannose dehydratase
MKTQIESVKQHILDTIEDHDGAEASDLHHYLLNESYFIIGTYKAKQWLGDETFDAIQKIKEYEQDNFGECNTEFSDPERVANMLAYILGEEILQTSETLQEKWGEKLDEIDLKEIATEIAA